MGALGRTLTPLRARAQRPALDPRRAGSPTISRPILFTSGSTGPAKGAQYSVGNFFAQRDALQALVRLQGGRGRPRRVPSLLALRRRLRDDQRDSRHQSRPSPPSAGPRRSSKPSALHKATSAFGSPAIWSRVAPWCAANGVRLDGTQARPDGGCSGAAQARPRHARGLARGRRRPHALRRHRVAPRGHHFGPRGRSRRPRRSRRGLEPASDGPRPPSTSGSSPIRDEAIASLDNEPALGPGEVGEICVRGGVVTRAYHNRGEATAPRRSARAKTPGIAWETSAIWTRKAASGSAVARPKRSSPRTARSSPIRSNAVSRASPRFPRVALVGVGPEGTGTSRSADRRRRG